jgi:hypothetical protein
MPPFTIVVAKTEAQSECEVRSPDSDPGSCASAIFRHNDVLFARFGDAFYVVLVVLRGTYEKLETVESDGSVPRDGIFPIFLFEVQQWRRCFDT